MARWYFPLLFLFFFALPAYSQKKELKTKFGKLSDKEIQMTNLESDPSAKAVVLFDKGELSHRYDNSNGFSLVFQRHMRVKIFKKEALDLADIAIWHHKDAKLGDIKASSFNMDNGKMVESKLDKNNVVDEVITKNILLTKFQIPVVKEGSIIDFSYTISSRGGLAMPDSWTFQREDVPVIWSEFQANVPSFVDYKKMSQGWVEYSLAEESQQEDKLTITFKDRSDGLTGSGNFENVSVFYTVNRMHFIQENIPALKTEDFVNSPDDYLSSIAFDIRTVYDTDLVPAGPAYRLINTTPNAYNQTWRSMGKDLLEDVYDKFLKSSKHTEAAAKTCVAGKSSIPEKIAAVYEHIGTNYQVRTEFDRIFPSQAIDALAKDRKGTPTDLNLLFINMMRHAGVDASPVLISTTDHGQIQTFRVSLDEMNRVIAGVQMEDSTLLLVDVAAFPNPVGLLAKDDLGVEGLLLQSPDLIKWIPLQNKLADKIAVIGNLKLSPEGELSGAITSYETGYNGVLLKKNIRQNGEEVAVKTNYKAWFEEGEISNLKLTNAANWNEPSLKMEFDLRTSGLSNVAGDKIYFSPMEGLGVHENPFKNPARKFNLDLGPTWEGSYILSVAIPAGYKVEEMPKTLKIVFGENDFTFNYITELKGDVLKINVKMKQQCKVVEVSEYSELQRFFSMMTSKMDEQIVLTKL